MKGNVYEESPQRPIKDKPKKSYTKLNNFQTIKVGINDNDSNMSTPKAEGGIVLNENGGVSGLQDINMNF